LTTVLRAGRVFTVDDARPWAQAVAFEGDRIVWVGRDDEVDAHLRPGDEQIDLRGRLLLPGFVDAHNHLRLGGGADLELNDAPTLEEIHRRCREHLVAHPEAEWLEAVGWNYSAIPEGRAPTAEDLPDEVTGGRPAFLVSYDAHTVWMNREAMRRFGIGPASASVPFGHVETDDAGEPTGFLRDFAVMGLAGEGQRALAAVLPSAAPDLVYRRLVENASTALSYGITTVVEPQNGLDDLPVFARLRREGPPSPRLIVALYHPPGTTRKEVDAFEEAKRAHDDDRLRVGPVKLYADDVIEPHTAAMLAPYANRPDTAGDAFWEPAELARTVTGLERRGFQTFTHATGDRGIRTALDAVEAARAANGPGDRRHQIVHVECLHADDLPRFGELGVVACMQPRHCAPEIVREWRENVGPERWPLAWAFRSLRDAGASLAFSSDWNVAEMDPLVGIYTALTRASLDGTESWVPEQTVDLETAIRAYTIGGAFANRCELDRGSISPGKHADLVALSGDPFAMEDPRRILEVRADITIVGGEVVFRRERV
jgi:hypothetical protein